MRGILISLGIIALAAVPVLLVAWLDHIRHRYDNSI
jgi:hypothetical protein